MAIDRGPWNALVDDDGSNLVGSLWNKAAIKTVILDPIDAFVPVSPITKLNYGPSLDVTIPGGSYNNWAPAGGTTAVVWMLAPSSPLGITGILAEAPGTAHLLVNTSDKLIEFHNQHANSSAGNKIIGPGYANYVLPIWGCAWMIYISLNVWLIQKP